MLYSREKEHTIGEGAFSLYCRTMNTILIYGMADNYERKRCAVKCNTHMWMIFTV